MSAASMLARAHDAIEEAVKEASALPASERRRKLNALRLKWHVTSGPITF